MVNQIKPGFFGKPVSADERRREYDIANNQLLVMNKQPDILFIGDSITNNWDLSLYFEGFGYLVNRGIGGDTTEYILKRSDADVFQLNPKKIVYLAGANDVMSIAPNLWFKEPGANKEAVMENIKRNIEAFMKKCGDISCIFCSILPMDLSVPFNNIGIEDMILQANETIQCLCTKYNKTYVDYYSVLCDESGRTMKAESYDGVHPLGSTYQIMAEVLKKAL